MKGLSLAVALLVIAVVIICLVWFAGTANPETKAGYMGYVTQGAVFGKTKFLDIQLGPTSYGRTWMAHAINVSITPYTYDEPFERDTAVFSKDNNKISFGVHFVFRIRPTKDAVRQFVEQFSGIADEEHPDKIVADAYKQFIKEPLRTYARNEVQRYEALQIKEKIVEIGTEIEREVKGWLKDSPFEVLQIAIGNIQLPESVATANATYVATEVLLKQKAVELDITAKAADIRIREAEGIAKSMKQINDSLTPAYLQYEAIKAQTQMINSPNHTVIYIPVGNMGVPLVGTLEIPPGPKAGGDGANK